jgi:hypothetical protein
VLAFGIDWAKSHGLVSPGQYAVLFRGQIADRFNIRAVLVGVVN